MTRWQVRGEVRHDLAMEQMQAQGRSSGECVPLFYTPVCFILFTKSSYGTGKKPPPHSTFVFSLTSFFSGIISSRQELVLDLESAHIIINNKRKLTDPQTA